MKILIVGSDLNAILLANYLKLQDSSHDIYLTQSCDNEDFTSLNISENDINSLCDFVKYNQIEFTIVTSSLSIINGIADIFKKEGFAIFAPTSESARVTYFNSIAKKIIYKLKINTPKFGIFDKENLAIDYLRKIRFPVTIENDFTVVSREYGVFQTFLKAKNFIQKMFENGNEKVVIENYSDIEPVYIYFITDGYNALPLIALERCEDENSIKTTAISQKITKKTLLNVLRNVVYPLLDDISKYSDCYTGILGIKVKINKDIYQVLEFYNGFQKYDFQAFLSLLDDDLLKLLIDAENGTLNENHTHVELSDYYSYSIAVDKGLIERLEHDFSESEDEKNLILTSIAPTINRAKEKLFNYFSLNCDKKIVDIEQLSEV